MGLFRNGRGHHGLSARAARAVLGSLLALALFTWGNAPDFSNGASAKEGDEAVTATREALARALKLLQRAYGLEKEGKLQESLDATRESIRAMEAMSGPAEMATRTYMLGQAYTLVGRILVRNGQLEDSREMLKIALEYYAPLYNADVDFFRQAARPGSGFEYAASNIGVTLDYLSQVEEALQAPDEAIRYVTAERDFFDKLGEDEMVLKTSQRILAILGKNPQLANATRRRAQALSDLALAMVHVGQAGDALRQLKEADSILATLPAGDPELPAARADAAVRTGYALQALGRHAEAIPALKIAASAYARVPGRVDGQLAALERLFASQYAIEIFPAAEQTLLQQIKVAQQVGGQELAEYRARNLLLGVYKRVGDYDRAKQNFGEMEKLAKRAAIPAATLAQATINMAVIHRDVGEHQAALASFEAAVRQLEDQPGTEARRAEYFSDMSTALSALDRPDEARARLQSGLKLVEGVAGAEVAAARLRRRLAEDDEQRLGRKGAESRECTRIVASLAEVKEANLEVVGCLVHIAGDQQRSGRFADSAATFRKALERLPDTGSVAAAIGRVSDDPGRQARWVALMGLGLASVGAGRDREARTHLIAASRLGRERYLNTLMSLPTLDLLRYMSDRTRRAGGDIAVALSFRSKDADVATAFQTALWSKSLFTEVSRRQRAELSRSMASDAVQARRYSELRRRVAKHVIDWQRTDKSDVADAGTVEALFREIRQLEGDLLRPLQGGQDMEKEENTLADRVRAALRRDQVLLEFVRFVPVDMKAVRELDIEALTSQQAGTQHYGVFVVSGATIAAVDLGPATRIDEAVLEYRRTQQSQSAPATFMLDEAALAKAAEPLRQLLIDPVATYIRGARRIYVATEGQLALLPFEAIPLGGAAGRPRYAVEDHEFVYLTTARDLLRSAEKASTSRSREAWLFGDPDFDAAAGQVIAALGAPARAPGAAPGRPQASTLLAETQQMGESGGDELATWVRLARTRELIDTVSTAAKSSGLSVRTFTGAAASEPNAATMQAPRVVMFATHGKFIDRSPTVHFNITSLSIGPKGSKMEGATAESWLAADPLFRSMLVLAGANHGAKSTAVSRAGDGLLTAYEAWGLDLNGTELVALTACETGLGVVQAGEGATGLRQPTGETIAGLRQAFMIAGARSMVMSMWPVPLGDTARLFDGFFTSWLGGRAGRYAAFRDAQLAALRDARERRGSTHPFWWAGFVFLGDPGDADGRR